MLQQILREMHVDKEILAGLDETQKQTLFCKMREEQVRRWKLWDAEESKYPKLNGDTEKRKKQVNFLKAADGDDWVWVMGDHADDYSIDEILALEATVTAKKMAEIETSELRKSIQAEFTGMLQYESTKTDNEELNSSEPTIDETEIYCSVDELKEHISKSKIKMTPQLQLPPKETGTRFNVPNTKDKEIKDFSQTNHNSSKVASKIFLWEQRLIGERTCEILLKLQMSQEQKLIEAEEAAKKQEELWQEQERKSKEAEIQRRSIARMAREEYRRSIQVTDIQTTEIKLSDDLSYSNSTPLSSLDVSLSKPPNKEAVMKWYREEELGRNSGLNSDGTSADWFHGLLSRHEAEDRLLHEKNGTFLVRLSEKIWGYAISYKALDRCKHYLVDSTNGKYRFLGANQISHESLGNLVKYHCNVPITESGQEFLTHSCKTSSDFISGLFQN